MNDAQSRAIQSITCATCKNYAWDHAAMGWPMRDARGHLHHPSCSEVATSTPAAPTHGAAIGRPRR